MFSGCSLALRTAQQSARQPVTDRQRCAHSTIGRSFTLGTRLRFHGTARNGGKRTYTPSPLLVRDHAAREVLVWPPVRGRVMPFIMVAFAAPWAEVDAVGANEDGYDME
jgi:hypothetical protein